MRSCSPVAYAFFLDYYREHKLDYTYAYEGVLEALAALRTVHDQPARSLAGHGRAHQQARPSRRRPSAKPSASRPISLTSTVATASPPRKPDPEGLFALMQEAGARPEETVMIGDSQVDVQTARNAGAWSIGCTFGLAPGSLEVIPPDVLVDSPADWTDALTPAKIDLGQQRVTWQPEHLSHFDRLILYAPRFCALKCTIPHIEFQDGRNCCPLFEDVFIASTWPRTRVYNQSNRL